MFAALTDSLFKVFDNKSFVLSGITFYGGLFVACTGMRFTLRFDKSKTRYNKKQWFDILTMPLISFHISGRIGCFFAGCCYGRTTCSILGASFPDNALDGIYHYGQKCYPTQLFEVAALAIIFVFVWNRRNDLIHILFYMQLQDL